jgi:hypothetical protein
MKLIAMKTGSTGAKSRQREPGGQSLGHVIWRVAPPLGRGHRLPSIQSAGRAVTCTDTFPLSHDARKATMPLVEPSFDL